jgi:hypothetical protein
MVLKVQNRLGASSLDVFGRSFFSIEKDVKNSPTYGIPISLGHVLTNEADDEIVFLTPSSSHSSGFSVEDDLSLIHI